MIDKIVLLGENSEKLALTDIEVDEEYLSALVNLQSDWFHASAYSDTSLERVKEFLLATYKMMVNRRGVASFINETGNFELLVTLDEATGRVEVEGVLIKSMIENSRISFVMSSDYESMNNFFKTLKLLLKSTESL